MSIGWVDVDANAQDDWLKGTPDSLDDLGVTDGDDDPWGPPSEARAAALERETREYGKGGQFAKGGGHIPGRGGAAPEGGSRSLTPDEVADFMGPSGASIRPHLVPDGQGGYKISAERHAMHEAFIADQLRGATPVDSPTTTILGGGPASGKSTAATLAGVPGPLREVH